MRHLVLFDIDGTILRTGGAGLDAMRAALVDTFGTSGDPEYRYDGRTDPQIARELMRGAGFDDETITARMPMLLRRYTDGLVARLAEPQRHVSMYPGVAALNAAVDAHPDMMLGLLTGNVDRGARLKLGAVGLDFDRFRVNAFGSDSEVRAQLPAIAHARMREVTGIDLAGSDVVVIGDTPADIACGRDLGARAIAVATGRYSVEELAAHSPYAVFVDLSDTEAVMTAIEGRVGAASTQPVER